MNTILQLLLYPWHWLMADAGQTSSRLKSIRALGHTRSAWAKRLLLTYLAPYKHDQTLKEASLNALSHHRLDEDEQRLVQQEHFLLQEDRKSRAFLIGGIIAQNDGPLIAESLNLSRVPETWRYFSRIEGGFRGHVPGQAEAVVIGSATDDERKISKRVLGNGGLISPDPRIKTYIRLSGINAATVLLKDTKNIAPGSGPYLVTASPQPCVMFRGTFQLKLKGQFENPDVRCHLSILGGWNRFISEAEDKRHEAEIRPGGKSLEERERDANQSLLNNEAMQYKPIVGDWLIFDACDGQQCSGVLHLQTDVAEDNTFDAIVYLSGLSAVPRPGSSLRRTTHCVQYSRKLGRQVTTYSAEVAVLTRLT